ncbi:hypothetical protein VTI28DRAFT_8419 [Corynascus sepedonium]
MRCWIRIGGGGGSDKGAAASDASRELGLESNRRLGEPLKASADCSQPLPRLHFSSTFPLRIRTQTVFRTSHSRIKRLRIFHHQGTPAYLIVALGALLL